MGHNNRTWITAVLTAMWTTEAPLRELSLGNDIKTWSRIHSCGILSKNVAAVCPFVVVGTGIAPMVSNWNIWSLGSGST